ncbi:CPBP family intramembrane glutamic endopeptidase [Tenacibaculum jejuense]|uniref:CAAX amino terminal protease family n=1 Tax=Tenacibaculum jejuense TaxID=584609 RepID=A0A238UEV5_9FLAO|nr:CPBP family intramembrane glutamic endopeptidase [Tenacibaculum jejuense]SNR16940.1 CAAX amino terminal protease family [Tenacibaculum jejuense]
MIETFKELVAYLKNPVLEEDPNTDLQYRLKKFGHLFIISVVSIGLLTPILALIEASGLINMDNHAVVEMMENLPKIAVFFFAAVFAPLIEEVIFRGPLTIFKEKKSFKFGFYIFAILFGLVHITNYTITTNVLLLLPVLVAPQIILGGYLGFIRIRFGLGWSILLHACYNAFFISLSFAGLST